ncbi:hypothetical protein [Streptomyces hokutonensis]|uniref:hypothetical protein n=1 Tax=Streptomyces hokutonensis TaxID=1306990 RepID=UPI0036CDD7F6
MEQSTHGEGNESMRQPVLETREFTAGGGGSTEDVPLPDLVRPEPGSRLVGRVGWLLGGCGFALLPWLYVLATGLPDTATAAHWPVAWVGLDALEAAGLIATGVLAARGDRRYVLTATATATLLVVDAWFDTTTAAAGGDLAAAATMALGAELPLAALCAWLALRAPGRPRRHSSPS